MCLRLWPPDGGGISDGVDLVDEVDLIGCLMSTTSTMSILSAVNPVNPVNLVNAVNAVKNAVAARRRNAQTSTRDAMQATPQTFKRKRVPMPDARDV